MISAGICIDFVLRTFIEGSLYEKVSGIGRCPSGYFLEAIHLDGFAFIFNEVSFVIECSAGLMFLNVSIRSNVRI